MYVKKHTNACEETYPLTDYLTNQRLLRTRICITFCAFTCVHSVYASPTTRSCHSASVYLLYWYKSTNTDAARPLSCKTPTKDVETQEQIQSSRARDAHFLQSTFTHIAPPPPPPPHKLIPSPHCMSFATAGAAIPAPQLSAWEQAGRRSGSAAREREREAEVREPTTSSRYISAHVC